MRTSYVNHPPIYLYKADVFKSTEGKKKYRRVVSMVKNRIYYCNGGNHIHSCLPSTFIRWARENKAVISYRINATF